MEPKTCKLCGAMALDEGQKQRSPLPLRGNQGNGHPGFTFIPASDLLLDTHWLKLTERQKAIMPIDPDNLQRYKG